MTRRYTRRSPRGAAVIPVSVDGPAEEGFTFPAALVRPPQSQLTQYSDIVADKIRQLDDAARRLGETFGISLTNWVLNPNPPIKSDSAGALLLEALREFAYREERVSLERRSGQWGLYFTRNPALIGQEKVTETAPLRDTALDVRERFLERSEYFFREYLDRCQDRLGRMKASSEAGDRTLSMLRNLTLE